MVTRETEPIRAIYHSETKTIEAYTVRDAYESVLGKQGPLGKGVKARMLQELHAKGYTVITLSRQGFQQRLAAVMTLQPSPR